MKPSSHAHHRIILIVSATLLILTCAMATIMRETLADAKILEDTQSCDVRLTNTPTPTRTSTLAPTTTLVPTDTPIPEPSLTRWPSQTPIPTPTPPVGFFVMRTTNDVVLLALFFSGIFLVLLSIVSPVLSIRPKPRNFFVITTLPTRISEQKRENIIRINLPPKWEWPSNGKAYFFVLSGNKMLPAIIETNNVAKSAGHHSVRLSEDMLPLNVEIVLYMGDEIVGRNNIEYWGNEGISFPFYFISPPSRHYTLRLHLTLASKNGSIQKIHFDSNITVTQFLGLTAGGVSVYNLFGVLLGLIIALLAFVIKTH